MTTGLGVGVGVALGTGAFLVILIFAARFVAFSSFSNTF